MKTLISYLALAILLALTIPTRVTVAADPVSANLQAACLTLDAALAVIEGKDIDEKNEAFNGGCFMSPAPVRVNIVAIRGEVVWAGDGLDDLMYLVEIEVGAGNTLYSWLIAAEWPTLKDQLRGNSNKI